MTVLRFFGIGVVGMNRHKCMLPILLVAMVALALGAACDSGSSSRAQAQTEVPLDDAEIITQANDVEEFDEFEVLIEINATDLDAGLQGMLDGDAWKWATVTGPGGQPIFRFQPGGSLAKHGVTETQWESNEPPFEPSEEAEPGYTLDDFLEMFPEGEYTARGLTVENDQLESGTELTHDLPAGPDVISPEEEEKVERGSDLTITWYAVETEFDPEDPQGLGTALLESDIVAYIVVAEYDLVLNPDADDEEEITRVLTIDVAADEAEQFSAVIPADFLPDEPPGENDELEFKIEVGAVEESGNRTFTEIPLELVNPELI